MSSNPGGMTRSNAESGGTPRILIDIDELSKRLSIAKGTLYNWVSQRRLPHSKVGRCLRFDVEEIEEFLRGCSTMVEAGKR